MRLSRAIMALALGIPLAGCALLFGGGDPAQLYRFGAEPALPSCSTSWSTEPSRVPPAGRG